MNTLINKVEMPTVSGTIMCVYLSVCVQAAWQRSVAQILGTTLLCVPLVVPGTNTVHGTHTSNTAVRTFWFLDSFDDPKELPCVSVLSTGIFHVRN